MQLDLFFNKEYLQNQFFLFAGPCVVESQEQVFEIAETLKNITSTFNIPFVFKASYRKANRSSISSFTGIGDKKALDILAQVKEKFQLPIVTDIHTEADAEMAAEVVDILQIPAFLCRQTSLLQAAAKTGKCVNIKKGQFLNAEAMQFPIQKVVDAGNENVFITERGTSFGYQDLIVDFRGIPIMKNFGKPVIMDCTHALQMPNQSSGQTGGQPQYVETMAKCALVAGADGFFIETHPNPKKALSDGANMLPLHEMENLIKNLVAIKKVI